MFNCNIEIWKNAAHGGGPWTRSIEGVHGPSPDKGSMDRGSMFCTFPVIRHNADIYKKTVPVLIKLHDNYYTYIYKKTFI